MLQKLVAVGGAVEQESFEVQVKARVPVGRRRCSRVIGGGPGHGRFDASRYHQFDTYWSFDDPEQGRLRYREDEFLDEAGSVTGARARLTLTGRTREERFGAVLLFRSRYLAPGGPLGALLSRVLPTGRPSASSKRNADAGWSPIAASSSTCTSIGWSHPARRRLLRRGEVADLVAPRRARQGGR